jgi:hypothetical protein
METVMLIWLLLAPSLVSQPASAPTGAPVDGRAPATANHGGADIPPPM